MKRKAVVILNQAHKLLPSQEALLNEKFQDWEVLPVPEEGWNLEEQRPPGGP